MTEVDQACKEIVEELESQGILDETLVIVTTDNGMFHGAHGLAGKWYPCQESIRVPLIVKDLRMPPDMIGTLNDALTLNVDLAPTIMEAANMPTSQCAHMQGRPMSDLYLKESAQLSNDMEPWRTEFYYEFPLDKGLSMPISSAVGRHDMKCIFLPQFNYSEMFNLTDDPFELHDVLNDAQHTIVLEELQDHHKQLQMEVT